MMKSKTIQRAARSFAVMAFLATGGQVMAQATDLARATCTDFLTLSASDQGQLALWLAGYYAGITQRPLVDPARAAAAPATLAELCTKTPQVSLIGEETRALFVLAPNQ
jgi:hypothetical protein